MLGLFLTPTILDGHNVFADHMTATVSMPAGSGSTDACAATNECFVLAEVTVDVGGEVTWTNDDTAAHTVTSGDLSVDPDNVGADFDSSIFMAGKTFSHKFDAAGEYPYFCMVHPWMVGTVLVEDSSTTYYDTYLTLEVKASSTAGNVRIYPQLTDIFGIEINTDNIVKISVDGNSVASVPSNQWYEISMDAGSHTIRADVDKFYFTSNPSSNYRSSSDEVSYTVPGGGGMVTYYDTFLTLQVDKGSTAGYVQVYPHLTYSSGEITADGIVEIYVDDASKGYVLSNQWSEDILVDPGSHIIMAAVNEFFHISDPSIIYRSSSDEVSYTVPDVIQPPTTPTTPTTPQPPTDGSTIAIVALVIVGAVGAGVGIALSKRKKKLPAIQTQSKSSSTLIKLDDTQFWVCPHCGKDTEAYSGKQYCRNCKVYL